MLDKSAVLIEAGASHTHAYFPCSGLLSLQTITHDGNSVEVAMIGREGMAPPLGAAEGAPAAYTTVVTVGGEALRLPADALHTARQRLARWLLTASDRVQSSRIELTHEQLAEVLGLQRTRVTVANVALQDAGAIASRHGRIQVVDRARLQLLSCECYTRSVP